MIPTMARGGSQSLCHMNTNDLAAGVPPPPVRPPVSAPAPGRPLPNTMLAGVLVWVAISAGFLGLKLLMQERPEFVGQPAAAQKAGMIQESPWVVSRKLSDDVSVIKPLQPELSDIRFDLTGRRDYRGLRTVMDMSGDVHALFVLTNVLDEPVYVLFKCPHPRTDLPDGGGLPASGLRLQASLDGVQENAGDAWLWSGTLAAHGGVNLEVSYQVASLKGASYRVGDQNGNPVKQLRVTFHRKDLAAMRFESGDGAVASADETVSWERRDFLAPGFYAGNITESRSLYQSLTQLLEIGPGICLLFLLAVAAVILARRELNAVQMVTLAAGYALYFPLILYLSAHLSFPLAVVVAAVVPGALLLNYARWLLGTRTGLLGGLLFLALFWVFPTLAAFAGWNRGMVLLCLGVVTLYVLIDLQNQALRRKVAAAVLLALFLWPRPSDAGEVQVMVPGEWVTHPQDALPALVAMAPAQYLVRQESNYFQVEVRSAFQVLRSGEPAAPLFNTPVYLQNSGVESADTNLAWSVSGTNGLRLATEHPGSGTLRLAYRVPVENRGGKRRAEIPVLAGVPGNVRLESGRHDLEILTGSLWGKNAADQTMVYDLGITGGESLALEWRDPGMNPPAMPIKPERPPVAAPVPPASSFYGIGLTRAQHLTVINSDGSCTHFAEFEMPASPGGEFRLRLPAGVRLLSISINGNEIQSPVIEDQNCRVKLPDREAQQAVDRLSFRLAYPPLRLGFIGTAELELPEVFQTAGTTEWVVALPDGFETQLLTSGLEPQNPRPTSTAMGTMGVSCNPTPASAWPKTWPRPG